MPGFYIASNAGYHAANSLCAAIRDMGYRAERFEPHIKALFAHYGIGLQLRNSLLALPGLGTRTALFAIATDCAPPMQYERANIPDCGACKLCQLACPFGAISMEGLNPSLCARPYMESADMPERIRKNLPGLLGCELCQAACPRNSHIGYREPNELERAAFRLERLAGGDIKEARALVGKNMCTKKRLQAQAAALLDMKKAEILGH